MCGRYTLRSSQAKLAKAFGFDEGPSLFEPRFNAAPTQTMPVLRSRDDGSGRELLLMRWGLIPSWASDKTIGNKLINARSEKAATTPAFRAAFRRHRCLVPADGFFEWEKVGRKKKPFFTTMKDDRPFAFAGLWDRWHRNDETLESFTILTTDANELLRPLHDRMPVILSPMDYDTWLDPQAQDPAALLPLLHTYAGNDLKICPVNPAVNSPKYDGPLCIEEQSGEQDMLF